jgi:hypothetical protein
MPFTVKSLLSDTQVQLEKSGTEVFGTAVEDFMKDGIGKIVPGLKQDPNKAADRKDGSWYATSYAAALAGATNFRPKLKFLFQVEFKFTPEAIAIQKGLGTTAGNEFKFMVKSVDRPKVDFEYEEDLNMYNFRTKALKKIRHRDLTIVFMDDTGNRVFEFVRMMMAVHSPITAEQFKRDRTLAKPEPAVGPRPIIGSGMSFSRNKNDTAHRGTVNSNFGNVLEYIRVKQIFVNPQETMANSARMVSFDFMNPRVVSFDFDELSHEANDVSMMTMMFDYDWMEMVNVGVINGANTAAYDETKFGVVAPGAKGAPMDITPIVGGGGSAAGGDGPLSKALGGILGKGAQQISSDLIGKAVKGVAGNSRLGQALAGQLTTQLSGPIGGLVSGASRDKIGGAISSFSNPFARTTTVADSNGGGQVVAGVTSAPTTGDVRGGGA